MSAVSLTTLLRLPYKGLYSLCFLQCGCGLTHLGFNTRVASKSRRVHNNWLKASEMRRLREEAQVSSCPKVMEG